MGLGLVQLQPGTHNRQFPTLTFERMACLSSGRTLSTRYLKPFPPFVHCFGLSGTLFGLRLIPLQQEYLIEPSVKTTIPEKPFGGNILYAIAYIMYTDHEYKGRAIISSNYRPHNPHILTFPMPLLLRDPLHFSLYCATSNAPWPFRSFLNKLPYIYNTIPEFELTWIYIGLETTENRIIPE